MTDTRYIISFHSGSRFELAAQTREELIKELNEWFSAADEADLESAIVWDEETGRRWDIPATRDVTPYID